MTTFVSVMAVPIRFPIFSTNACIVYKSGTTCNFNIIEEH